MNPASDKNLQVSTPTDTTIVLTRTFKAARRLVWEAFFTPDKMRRWMLPPPGWTLTLCECEARVGGEVRLAWKSAEADPVGTLQGVFTEVSPHEHAVHTETMVFGGWEGSGQVIGSLVEKHEFAEVASGGTGKSVTNMRITQTYQSKEARDGALASGMDQGMEAGYQELDAVLAQLE